MKLLLCTDCTDVFRLFGGDLRYCRCGKAAGRYVDEKRAEVYGPVAVLGADNAEFEAAYVRWRDADPPERAEVPVYFLPSNASTVTEHKKAPVRDERGAFFTWPQVLAAARGGLVTARVVYGALASGGTRAALETALRSNGVEDSPVARRNVAAALHRLKITI